MTSCDPSKSLRLPLKCRTAKLETLVVLYLSNVLAAIVISISHMSLRNRGLALYDPLKIYHYALPFILIVHTKIELHMKQQAKRMS